MNFIDPVPFPPLSRKSEWKLFAEADILSFRIRCGQPVTLAFTDFSDLGHGHGRETEFSSLANLERKQSEKFP